MRILCATSVLVLLHLILISAACSSSCGESSANDVIRMNTSGNALEEAVIDAISQQSKINSRVELRHWEISRVTKSMLKNVSSIRSIDFQSNKITEIENGSFDGSENLEKIDLMENCLRNITKHVFGGGSGGGGDYHELREINLSFNAIGSIEAGSFDKFIKLSSIDLSSNCVRHLHADLFVKCSELRKVRLQHNEITKIEFHLLARGAELSLLDLSYNHLDSVPSLRARSIHNLNVSHNKLVRLDLSYYKSHEAQLEALDASHNNISEIAEGLRTDILQLDVSHNQITDLQEFPALLNLEMLLMSHNNLSDLCLPKFEERFPSLRVLNISENHVKCSEQRYLRKILPKISVSAGGNCRNLSSYDDYFVTEITNTIQSRDDEIFRQLKLNRLLLIALLSMFTVLVSLPIVFLLRHHCFPIKHTKENCLIEQIEL